MAFIKVKVSLSKVTEAIERKVSFMRGGFQWRSYNCDYGTADVTVRR